MTPGLPGRAYPKAVIFDLDGTLVDSAADIAEALNAALRTEAMAPFSVREVQDFIGGGSMVLMRKALDARDRTVDEATWARLVQHFMQAYHTASARGRGLYPGADAALQAIAQRGAKLAICTNKPHPVTETAMPPLGIAHRFQVILGATEQIAKKPAPDMIQHILGKLGVAPGDAVMVGDSAADSGAGRAAGLKVVLVSFGYAKIPVRDLNPDAVIDHLSELPDVLAALG